MLFDNTDFNFDDFNVSVFAIPGSDFKEERENKFVSPEEGFLRGNLMKGEYKPYKNYTYLKLKPENAEEELLFKLMTYSFAINDLNLYLDLYPNDKKLMICLRNMFK